MPQSKRNGGEFQSAVSAPTITHIVVATTRSLIFHSSVDCCLINLRYIIFKLILGQGRYARRIIRIPLVFWSILLQKFKKSLLLTFFVFVNIGAIFETCQGIGPARVCGDRTER